MSRSVLRASTVSGVSLSVNVKTTATASRRQVTAHANQVSRETTVNGHAQNGSLVMPVDRIVPVTMTTPFTARLELESVCVNQDGTVSCVTVSVQQGGGASSVRRSVTVGLMGRVTLRMEDVNVLLDSPAVSVLKFVPLERSVMTANRSVPGVRMGSSATTSQDNVWLLPVPRGSLDTPVKKFVLREQLV